MAESASSSQGEKSTWTCRFFTTAKGCRFGDDCRFLHQKKELDKVVGNTDEENERNETTATKSREINVADLSQVQSLLPKMTRTSRSEADRENKDQNSSKNRRGIVCRYYRRKGGCARGHKCPFSHENLVVVKRCKIPNAKESSKNITEKTPRKDVAQSDNQEPHEKHVQRILQPVPNNALPSEGKEISKQTQLKQEKSAKQQVENVEPTTDKNSSKQRTFWNGDLRSEAAACNSALESSRLRATEIQQLKRRFGVYGFCEELKENAKFRVKFTPTDPDWPFKLDSVYLTVHFPDEYPKEIFTVTLTENQGLPEEIARYVNQRIVQWAKNQLKMAITQGVLKLHFRPFLRWFDRNLESFFVNGGRQAGRGYIAQISNFSRKKQRSLYKGPSNCDLSSTSNDHMKSGSTYVMQNKEQTISELVQDTGHVMLDKTPDVSRPVLDSSDAQDTPSVTTLDSHLVQNVDDSTHVEHQTLQDQCKSDMRDSSRNEETGICSAASLYRDRPFHDTITNATVFDPGPCINVPENAFGLPDTATSKVTKIDIDSEDSDFNKDMDQNSTALLSNDTGHDVLRTSSSVHNVQTVEHAMRLSQLEINEDIGDKSSTTAAQNSIRRGTEIRFKGLDLAESTSTLRAVKLSLTLECGRCHQRIDQQISASRAISKQCIRCSSHLIVAYHPEIIHQFSSVLGFLDLDSCSPFDVVLPESEFMLGCLHCSKETLIKGLQYGSNKSWCGRCHQKLGFHIQSTRFQGTQTNLETAASLKKSAVSSAGPKPKKPAQNLGIKEGQPLPGNGTCKHYKKSYRWLRFPCCGKCYSCDICHEENESHEMKFATRMVCGFCSKEQPYSQHPCSGCKSAVTKSHSAHWEGGRGCRDKTRMSRNDDKKYRQVGKTVSRKAQKQSETKGKGKGRK